MSKHPEVTRLADSAVSSYVQRIHSEIRCCWCEIGNIPNVAGQHYTACVYAPIVACPKFDPEKQQA